MKAYPYLLTGALLAALSACHKNNDNASPQPASLSTATLAPATTAIRVASLPAPYATIVATNYPQMLMDRPAGTPLSVPAGYAVNIFQDKVPGGRWLAVAPNGDVFVAQMGKNQIMVLHDADQNGTADATSVWAMGSELDKPEGMAFNGNYLYVACSGAILRYDYTSGQTVASGAPTQIAKVLGGGQHFARTLLIANNKMYVGVGSSLNVVVEQDPGRATIQELVVC